MHLPTAAEAYERTRSKRVGSSQRRSVRRSPVFAAKVMPAMGVFTPTGEGEPTMMKMTPIALMALASTACTVRVVEAPPCTPSAGATNPNPPASTSQPQAPVVASPGPASPAPAGTTPAPLGAAPPTTSEPKAPAPSPSTLPAAGAAATATDASATSGAHGSAPTKACTTSKDCAANEMCVGPMGCEASWTCQPATPCTRDRATFCGCDGRDFQSSSTCPLQRYRAKGSCSGAASTH